jgi:hypothetical protein
VFKLNSNSASLNELAETLNCLLKAVESAMFRVLYNKIARIGVGWEVHHCRDGCLGYTVVPFFSRKELERHLNLNSNKADLRC